MPKRSIALASMPPPLSAHLAQLGENLAIARKRRRETRKAWAQRIGVSQPTLSRMERGDPGVAVGVYATALWLIGRAAALPEFAAPQQDLGALEHEVRAAQARSVRKPVSPEERLRDIEPPSPAARPRRTP